MSDTNTPAAKPAHQTLLERVFADLEELGVAAAPVIAAMPGTVAPVASGKINAAVGALTELQKLFGF